MSVEGVDPEAHAPARRIPRWLRLGVRIGVPVLALAFIVWRVDFGELLDALRRTNLAIVAVALAAFPLRYALRPLRWQLMLKGAFGAAPPMRETLRLSWIALGVGWLTPGGIGSDVYRVAAMSRPLGRPALNAAVVLAEKLLMLVACAILVVAFSFFLPDAVDARRDDVRRFVLVAAAGLVVLACGIVAARFAVRARVVRWLDLRLQRAVAAMLAAVRARTRLDVSIPEGGIRGALRPLARGSVLLPVLGVSIAIPVVTALTTQVMFRAVGYDLPVVVNLFVTPLMFLILSIPLAPGAIGIRESAAIVLYGMFDVPADIVLLVSLLTLVGTAMNSAAGGMVLALSRARDHDPLLTGPDADDSEPGTTPRMGG